jgi:hypothetical protein
MWKIVAIILLTATVILLARLVFQAPVVQTHLGAFVSDMRGGATEPLSPQLMYAGVRG